MTYEKPAELAAQAGFTHLAPQASANSGMGFLCRPLEKSKILLILKRWQNPNRSTSSIFSQCMQ